MIKRYSRFLVMTQQTILSIVIIILITSQLVCPFSNNFQILFQKHKSKNYRVIHSTINQEDQQYDSTISNIKRPMLKLFKTRKPKKEIVIEPSSSSHITSKFLPGSKSTPSTKDISFTKDKLSIRDQDLIDLFSNNNQPRSKPRHGVDYADYDIDDTEEDEDLTIPPSPTFRSGYISILGNPNVGKSTLINSILREKLCIVSPKPQTTRHGIYAIRTTNDSQMVFIDTPGVLNPVYSLQKRMKTAINANVWDNDIILIVSDVFGEEIVDPFIMTKLNQTNSSIIVVINKVDLLNRTVVKSCKSQSKPKPLKQIPKVIGVWNPFEDYQHEEPEQRLPEIMSLDEVTRVWKSRLPKAEIIDVSALKNVGIDKLLNKLEQSLPLGPKYFPSNEISTRPIRFFVTEFIREVIFNLYQDEIPYSTEVYLVSYEDKGPNLTDIQVKIVVERDSQKAIIIGKKGNKLKELGIKARHKLEEFLQKRVYLSLTVSVDKDWRNNDESLRRYGY